MTQKITRILTAVVLAAAVCHCVRAEESVRRGAKITKEVPSKTDAPTLTVPDGWKICPDEKWTGLNPREYYFTLETKQKNPADPVVQVVWPNVSIGAVYGGTDVKKIDGGVEFQVTSANAPTAFTSILPPFGAVRMGIFHNVKGMQAGPYRGLPYPEKQIAAQLNYLFAAREMMREAGFTASSAAVDAVINLYGFETNFPNGHEDFPPHFHIMTMWDSWRNIQATHFILDENGKITENNHYVVVNGAVDRGKSVKYAPGEPLDLTDRTGETRFTLSILPDGSGVEMRIPGRTAEYRIASQNAVESVSCYIRASGADEWKLAAVSRVSDDSIRGVLTVETEQDGSVKKEIWRYQPATGALIER